MTLRVELAAKIHAVLPYIFEHKQPINVEEFEDAMGYLYSFVLDALRKSYMAGYGVGVKNHLKDAGIEVDEVMTKIYADRNWPDYEKTL